MRGSAGDASWDRAALWVAGVLAGHAGLLLMHGAAELRDSFVNKTFRKLTWTGGWHPKTYTIADRDELMSSDAWFARKFDASVDATILDAVDAHLREQASAPVR